MIIHKMESRDLGLSESLTAYEQGVTLLRHLHEELSDIEQRVVTLVRIDEEDHRLNLRQAEADILSPKASMTSGLAQVANAQAQARQAEARLATEQAEADAANEEWRLLGKTGNPPALLSRQPQIREARSAIAAAVALVDSATAGIESGKVEFKILSSLNSLNESPAS